MKPTTHESKLNSKVDNSESDEQFEYALLRLQADNESQIKPDKNLTENIIRSVNYKVEQNNKKSVNWGSWLALSCALFIAVISVKMLQPEIKPNNSYIELSQLQVIPQQSKPEFIIKLEQDIAKNRAQVIALNQNLKEELARLDQTYLNRSDNLLYSRIAQVMQSKNENALVFCKNSQSFIYQPAAQNSRQVQVNWDKLSRQNQLVQVVFDKNGKIVALVAIEPTENTVTCPV
ncbi:hypothetical protein N7931_09520 [Catenovulum sp. 2E275]|uniref:hypothetical protein n=1 Tax=Catenovulum sp. 2E275 TaxID=2980497 RepID=UPI0021D1D4B9|nr:hypothetical protein [Catenovulum sp. 2E275]MCU4675873.1 hypothetical protein [Catenovulum sp. 2E275]